MKSPMPALMPVLGLVATALAALIIVWKGLVIPVLLALLVYAWSCMMADRIVGPARAAQMLAAGHGHAPRWPTVLAGTLVTLMVITAFVLLTFWTIRLASSDDLRTFLFRIEDSLEVLRKALPAAIAGFVPENWADLKTQVFSVLRSKAAALGSLGGTVAHTIVQALFAILVGALAAISTWEPYRLRSDQLFIARLLVVLERVVIAQIRIAMFNTAMTAVYLFFILPFFDIHLPFRGLLCMFTLLTGVLPVLGNLMANTILSLISFAISPWVAIASLTFLILIHKLEYVINARTVGSKISMNSWEILAAMLTGEALFGVRGLVTAPLLYPFFKREIGRIWPRKPAAVHQAAALEAAQAAAQTAQAAKAQEGAAAGSGGPA
ncbi:MAG: AI-2E family transporter [Lautropia sp.]|nr:AI-2E family transporter [Lautropia sp.]